MAETRSNATGRKTLAEVEMRKILVPIDGSDAALRALAHAVELARAAGAKIVMVNVQQTLERWYAGGLLNNEALTHLRQQGEADGAKARALVDAAGLTYEFDVLFGQPGEVIARVAKEQSCIGIVMGARGLSDLDHLFLGSTAHKVIQLAEAPVTLVK
ncbi:MAG: universal stress protein [Rubrivivax sp.]|nr:universal stress protein [Betaproteobacteria bacterium]MBP6316715.1 universal stress protein [Rubrivivax sp.]MBK7275458.1 universal stress protein [Betaproteobacteria bacterium]MBK8107135.1 universal stress protein [Betaproteobacteria bacterium]MBK9682084.1 universal stress protein [Betaproteobacteria bacterium]